MQPYPLCFSGPRAQLLPLDLEHIDELYEFAKDPILWRFSSMRVTTREDLHALAVTFLDEQRQGHTLPFVIRDRQTERLVGCTQIHSIALEHRQAEIGKTWLAPATWGSGLNTECKYLLLAHCFEALDLLRVQFRADGRNLRSQRAIEHLGATKEGVLRQCAILRDGFVRDLVYYSILATEWPACKERLEARLATGG